MGLNTTHMQMLKKQIDESFAHLRAAITRRRDLLHQQITIMIREQYTVLPDAQMAVYESIRSQAILLQERIDEFEDWLGDNHFRAIDEGSRIGVGSTHIGEAKVMRHVRWIKSGSDQEIQKRKTEIEEMVNVAIFDIEERRLGLNREVLEDNVENAEEVLKLIPTVEELLPTPKYLEAANG